MKDRKELLGIFDSGVGGFSVVQEVRKGTDADIVYFGDCARAPYGNRNEEEIVSFIKEILFDLQSQGVTHFVSACNSMSVITTDRLLEEVGIGRDSYIDMVDAVRMIPFDESAHVLIVGTQATMRSSVYQNLLREQNIKTDTFIPHTLAGEIENGNEDAIRKSVQEIIFTAVSKEATHIVYACTHYPLVDSIFKEEAMSAGWKGNCINPAKNVAIKVNEWNLSGNKGLDCVSSQETEVFNKYRSQVC